MTWHAMPPRQLTGAPWAFHGYVSTNRRVMTDGRLCHDGFHRSGPAARRCAERKARKLNRADQYTVGSANPTR